MPGARPARRQVGDREKLDALVRLKAGESVHAVAKSVGVEPSTVRRWRDQARAVGETFPQATPPDAPGGDPGDPQNKRAYASPLEPAEVAEHLARYMAEALEALHVQNRLFSDEGWLRDQSVDDVAVAHGVLFDKLARLAAGARGALPAPAEPAPAGPDGRAGP